MLDSILNRDVLRAALRRLDLTEVARRTVEAAEDYMPGCAWLDRTGEVHFAETMSEVDGLVLCQAREPDEDDEFDDCYWVGGWLGELELDEVAQRLEHELNQALGALSN